MRSLRGQTTLITGASGGVGRAVARRLASTGARLVLTGRDASRLDALARELPDALTVAADLTDAPQRARLAERVLDEAGPVTLLVHVAGTLVLAPFEQFDGDQLAAQVAIDLTAPLQLTRLLLPGMLARSDGHVVFVGSLAALLGGAFQVPYAASKSGLDAASRALRAEYRERGVGFSVVHPAPVRQAGRYAQLARSHGKAPWLVGSTTPERVAKAVVRAAEHDLPSVTLTRRPAAALVALRALAPRCADALVEATGQSRYLSRIARS